MRIRLVALGLVLLGAGIAAVLLVRGPDSPDDATESGNGVHRVKIGEIELHIPRTVAFQVPDEGTIRPGAPLFSGSVSERYVQIPLNQILNGSSPNVTVFIGWFSGSVSVDQYCKTLDEFKNDSKKWHRRVDPDGVVIYVRLSESRRDRRPEDLEDYLELNSNLLNRPIFVRKDPIRTKSGSGKDIGPAYHLMMKLTPHVSLEMPFTDAEIPRPTWPEAFATIDKALSQWIQRSDAVDSGQPQPFKADDCRALSEKH